MLKYSTMYLYYMGRFKLGAGFTPHRLAKVFWFSIVLCDLDCVFDQFQNLFNSVLSCEQVSSLFVVFAWCFWIIFHFLHTHASLSFLVQENCGWLSSSCTFVLAQVQNSLPESPFLFFSFLTFLSLIFFLDLSRWNIWSDQFRVSSIFWSLFLLFRPLYYSKFYSPYIFFVDCCFIHISLLIVI